MLWMESFITRVIPTQARHFRLRENDGIFRMYRTKG